MKKPLVLLLGLILSLSSLHAQQVPEEQESANFGMFCPYISISSGDGFGIGSSIILERKVFKHFYTGIGYEFFAGESMNPEKTHQRTYSGMIPFELRYVIVKPVSLYMVMGPLFESSDISVVSKFGFRIDVDEGYFEGPKAYYRIYFIGNLTIVNYETPNKIIQIGLGISIFHDGI